MEKQFGNSLEIEEAANALKGKMEEDVREIVLTLSSYILKLAGLGENLEENREKAIAVIENGKAYRKFLELIQKQHGDIHYLEHIPRAKYIMEIKAKKAGYLCTLNAEKCGKVSLFLGAGREKKEDKIDSLAGIILEKKIGDQIEVGDTLAYLHTNQEDRMRQAAIELEKAFEIGEVAPNPYQHIFEII